MLYIPSMGLVSWIIDSAVEAVNPKAGLRRKRARAILKGRGQSYHASKNNEIFRNFGSTSLSANADLADVQTLRNRSRQAYRNYPGARAGIEARVGIVISTGIDVEPDTGDDKSDEQLREGFKLWCNEADAAGKLTFKELQRQAYRAEALNGASLTQIVHIKDESRLLPFALHPLEADQLSPTMVEDIPKGHTFSNGVEKDQYGREVFYHIIDHPGDNGIESIKNNAKGRRIPAKEIIHTYQKLRPGQTTGEPILVPALQRLVQEEELVEAELESAKIGAAWAIALTSQAQLPGELDLDEEEDEDNTDDVGNEVTSITAGTIAKLNPGEDAKVLTNTRPSQAIDPFRKMLRGDIAASLGVSRVDLDKDYGDANYSSMRADMLDKKRQLTPEQIRFGHMYVSEVYKRILPLLAAKMDVTLAPKKGSDLIKRLRQERHKLVPDGWAYVDPQKDIAAALMAIKGGLSTYRDEHGSRGQDYREVFKQLGKELENPTLQKLLKLFEKKDIEELAEALNNISLKDKKDAA